MVITFITSSNLKKCAKNLDQKRLGKQRVEAKIILDTILNQNNNNTKGWKNHPSTKMWMDYPDALKVYYNTMVKEWINRGYENNMKLYDVDPDVVEWPWWFFWRPLHLSHRASLIRKNPEYYEQIFKLNKKEEDYLKLGYIWVSKLTDEQLDKIINDEELKPEDICESIATGAPAQYKWTEEEIIRWIKNKNKNPRTGRKINPDAKTGIYKNLEKAAQYYGVK